MDYGYGHSFSIFFFFHSLSSSQLAGRIHGQKKWKEDFAAALLVVWLGWQRLW